MLAWLRAWLHACTCDPMEQLELQPDDARVGRLSRDRVVLEVGLCSVELTAEQADRFADEVRHEADMSRRMG